MKKAFVLLALAVSTQAGAANWEKFLVHGGSTYYVDRGSITTKNGKVRIWIKDVTENEKALGDAPYSSVTILHEFDCELRETRFITAAFATADGKNVHTNNEPTEPVHVMPGSTREAFYNEACGKPAQARRRASK